MTSILDKLKEAKAMLSLKGKFKGPAVPYTRPTKDPGNEFGTRDVQKTINNVNARRKAEKKLLKEM